MRRKLSGTTMFLLCLLFVSVLTACGPSPDDDNANQTSEESSEVDSNGSSETDNSEDAGSSESNDIPNILTVHIVAITESDNEVIDLGLLVDGVEIDFSGFGYQFVNLEAVSADESQTGSVGFVLDGPTSINRVENDPEYTLVNVLENWDTSQNEPLEGSYTLTVTPYANSNGEGEAGAPYSVSFTVVAPEEVDSELPVAYDDLFVTSINTALVSRSVAENDNIDESIAVYSVSSTSTANGTVEMAMDGSFTYTPNIDFVGTDSFVYEVSQNGNVSSATSSVRVINNGGSDGFTPIVPSADSKIIYVSSSEGSDSNNCLSEAKPCRSLAAAYELIREGYPDHVLLKRGDVWRGEVLRKKLKSGRSISEPGVLSFYGESGPRPRIELAEGAYSYAGYILKNYHFIGLELASYKLEVGNPEFTGDGNDKTHLYILGGSENLLFEDNLFTHSALKFQAWDGDGDGVKEHSLNVIARRNIFTGIYTSTSSYNNSDRPSNMYVSGTEGFLLEENVFDYGGWHPTVDGAAANQFNHNVYIQYHQDSSNLIVRNNIVVRGSSHGVQGRPGGVYEDNFFARNAVSLTLGYPSEPLEAGVFAIARNNVITEGLSMVRGKDACSGTNLCTKALWGCGLKQRVPVKPSLPWKTI